MICVSDGIYTQFRKNVLAVPHGFIKMFDLQQSRYLRLSMSATVPVASTKNQVQVISIIRSEKSLLSFNLLTTIRKKSNHKKYHAYLNLVYSICHRFDIYRLVKLLISTFWYTGSKLSTMNTTTWRLPHSSLINISLGKSTKFPIPSIAFSIITTLTKE